ncbi:MAG: hypothetical protein M3367_18585, partial [Acidobacteriota bacterium]|nr:hypothetical protein [Acidobacteriota bacterium]
MATDNPDQKIDQRDLRQIVADKINPLPRSILRRTAFEVLDGEWKFAFDVQNRGRKERWYKKHNYTETALFPGSIESHLSAAKSAFEASLLYNENDEVVAWYEREFSISE